MKAQGPRDNALYNLWNVVRDELIEAGRVARKRVPDWYFDNWYMMTERDRHSAYMLIADRLPPEINLEWAAENAMSGVVV